MKTVSIPDIGEVQLVKNSRSRSIKMTIDRNSTVKVTIPSWAPYKAGELFVLSKQEWIKEHIQPKTLLKHGDPIGKFHHLYFRSDETVKTVTSRQKGSTLWVTHPHTLKHTHETVQASARKISMKALRVQAQNTLPQRLTQLAKKHGFEFSSVSVRQLKARWGSCSSKQEITLNFFLMQLPWELIDYVLLHELTHTKAMHHGPEFWKIFDQALPNAKSYRKQLHAYAPYI